MHNVEGGDQLYEKFVELLQKHGVSAYKVAKDTGLSQSTLSDWKTGRATPKVDKLLIIARYFGVSIEYFLSDETIRKDE